MHKPLSLNRIGVLLVSVFFLYSFSLELNEELPLFKDFTKKEYFKTIFSKSEQTQILKYKQAILKLEQKEKKIDALIKQSDKQKRIAKLTQSEKTKKKALKKETKLNKKINKLTLKFFPSFYSNYKQIGLIYSQVFKKTRPKSDSAHYQYAQRLQQLADIDINLAKNSYSFSKNTEATKKAQEFIKIRKAMRTAISNYEYAFASLMGDSLVKLPSKYTNEKTNHTEENKSSIAETQKSEKSNIVTVNGSIYVSFESEILKHLKIDANEKKQLEDAQKMETKADLINETVDKWYTEIDFYRYSADTAKTQKAISEYKNKADEIEGRSFMKLIEATEIYLMVNKTKFQIYKKYLDNLEITNESQKSKIEMYKMEANTLFSIADTKRNLSKRLPFISEKYIKLMESNELALLSIEKQEAAFLFYFAIPESSTNIVAESEKIVTPIEEQLESKTEKPSAGNKIYPRTYNYTVLKQSQVDIYSLTSDFVYRIQVGAFKRFPSVELAKKYKLSSKKLKYKDLNVYYLGDFKTYEAINFALDEVRAKGYNDAFIISYINGKLCSPAQAQNAIRKNKTLYSKYLEAAKYELFALKSGKSYYQIYSPKAVVKNNQKSIAKETEKEGEKGLAFYVQLGSFSKAIVPNNLKQFMPLLIKKKKTGLYGILKGPFAKYTEAQNAQKDMRQKGVKDAYIVAFNNDKAIELHKAISMQKSTKKTTAKTISKTGVIAYRLQVAAYKGNIPNELQNKLDEISKSKPVEKFKQQNGLTIYTVGYYTNYKSASLAKEELKKYKINDSFVIAFKDNEKISLSEARKIKK